MDQPCGEVWANVNASRKQNSPEPMAPAPSQSTAQPFAMGGSSGTIKYVATSGTIQAKPTVKKHGRHVHLYVSLKCWAPTHLIHSMKTPARSSPAAAPAAPPHVMATYASVRFRPGGYNAPTMPDDAGREIAEATPVKARMTLRLAKFCASALQPEFRPRHTAPDVPA